MPNRYAKDVTHQFVLNERSLAFAEDLVPPGEAIAYAHDTAVSIGAPTVSNGVCSVLTFLARTLGAKNIVEVGTSTGAASMALVDGLTADGTLTSIDTEADQQQIARDAFRAQGVGPRKVRLISGPLLQVLGNLQDDAYDLMFINANKLEYVEYVDQASRLLRDGGVLVVNDVLWNNAVADPRDDSDESVIIREAIEAVLASEDFTPALIPLGQGLLVAVRGS